MANRVMIHRGKVTVEQPSVVIKDFNPETGVFEDLEIQKTSKITYELADGSMFGNFPIKKPITVPKNWQGILKKKGFEFVNEKERKEFESEETAMDELLKSERERAFAGAAAAPGGISGKGEPAPEKSTAKGGK